MSSRIKKVISLLLLTVIALVLCLFANDLVAFFLLPTDVSANKTNMVDYKDIPDNAVCIVKGEGELGDFFEKYQIDGAAFCELNPGDDNSNRVVELFLVSEKNTYKIEAGSAIRVDVYYDLVDSKKMANGKIGFQAEFSTINIKNGIYELKAYVCENNYARGLSSFNVFYIKDSNGFRRHD